MLSKRKDPKKSKPKPKPKPMTPKAGVTRNNNGRRYGCGGKLNK